MKKISIKAWRRALQIGIALAFIVFPILNRNHIHYFYGNFLSFNALGMPLADPLAALQVSIKSWHLPVDLLIGSGIAFILAACLGTVFCSWVCPFGLLSEWAQEMSQRMLPQKFRGVPIKASGFRFKTLVFLSGFFYVLLFSDSPALNQLSMPGWYSRVFQILAAQGWVSLAAGAIALILLLEFAARSRLWCRYVCPQAYLLVLAKLANPFRLRVGWEQKKCVCGHLQSPCQRACSLSLNPKTLGDSPETECTNCGDCVAVCKRINKALEFRVTSDPNKPNQQKLN